MIRSSKQQNTFYLYRFYYKRCIIIKKLQAKWMTKNEMNLKENIAFDDEDYGKKLSS